MGPMYLSAILKKYGHHCRLIILSEHKNYLTEIIEYDPDLIALSTMTGSHNWVLKIAETIKKKVARIAYVMSKSH
jgi:hypothetical protein